MRMRNLAPAIAVVLTLSLSVALVACGDGSATDGTSTDDGDVPAAGTGNPSEDPDDEVDLSDAEFVDKTAEADVMVQARDNTFLPTYIEISAGTPVTFRNVGRTEHNVLPAAPDAFEPIEVDGLAPGDESVLVLDDPGDYPYYCSLHGTTTRGMVGAIRVVE